MKQRSPMSRGTGFKRQAATRPAVDSTERRASAVRALMNSTVHGLHKGTMESGGGVGAVAKFTYVRSKALLVACRGIPCQYCGRSDGTVVAAHSNELQHGKGRSVKASDIYVASLCFECHHEVDQGSRMSKAERQGMWDTAHRRTVALLVANGTWPLDVELPDTRRMN